MTFRTLGEVLQTAVAQGIIDGLGEAGVAAPALRRKRTPTEAGAKWEVSSRESPVDALPANKAHANREMIIAPPNGSPRPAVVISLCAYRELRRHHATPF